jgi:hydrogenase maturation protease
MMDRNSIAVIGLGNLLMRDEGVGLIALKSIEDGWKNGGVDFVHAGTPSMGLLHHFEGRRKLIFLDGGMCGSASGEFRRFLPYEVKTNKAEKRHSLHEFDLIKLIDFAKKLGLAQQMEIVIYCMEIFEMECGDTLSECVVSGLPAFVDAVTSELSRDIISVEPEI